MPWLVIAAAVIAGGTALTALRLRHRYLVVTVHGRSMEPALHDGDRVLVRREPLDRVRIGDIVVIDADGFGHAELAIQRTGEGTAAGLTVGHDRVIKRVAALPGDPVPAPLAAVLRVSPGQPVPGGKLLVLGDNAAHSFDSRQRGYYDGSDLLGVVSRPMR